MSGAAYVLCVVVLQPGKRALRCADMRPIKFSPDLLRVTTDLAGKDAFMGRRWRSVATRRIRLDSGVRTNIDQDARSTR